MGARDAGMAETKYATMREFWPFYLREHSRRGTRALHLIGTAIALACIVLAIVATPWFLLGGLVAGYAFAWVAHFFVEHNRPATFKHPLWSLAGDYKMVALMLAGRMGEEVERAHADG